MKYLFAAVAERQIRLESSHTWLIESKSNAWHCSPLKEHDAAHWVMLDVTEYELSYGEPGTLKKPQVWKMSIPSTITVINPNNVSCRPSLGISEI